MYKTNFVTNYDKFVCNFSLFYFAIMILEFIQIIISVLESTILSQFDIKIFLEYMFYLNYMSPFYYLKTYISCTTQSQNTNCEPNIIYYLVATIIPYSLSIIVAMIFSTYQSKNNKLANLVIYIFINCFEFIMNVFSLCIIFLMMLKIINTIQSNTSSITSYFFILFYFFNFILFLILNVLHLETNKIIITFNKNKNFYKDNLFSHSYNIFLLVLKILISIRDSFSLNNQNSNKKFISILIFIIVLLFNLNIFYKVFYKKIIFMVNYKFNILRVSLSLFLLFQSLYKLLFGSHMSINYATIPNFFICLILAIIFVERSNTNIIENSDKINQLILIVNEVILRKDSINLVRKIEFFNSLNSKIEKKKRFKVYPDCDVLEYCFNLIDEINSEIKDDFYTNNFNDAQKKNLKLCSLILFSLDQNKKNKFIYAIKKEIDKKYNLLDNYEFSCISLYQNTNLGEEFYKISKINKIIETYNSSNSIIQKCITDFSRILENPTITFNATFYSLVGALAHNKIELCKNINIMLEKRNLYIDNFNFFTIYYTYDFLFKEKIAEVENVFNEEEMHDLMMRHYKIDSILSLSYSLRKNEIKIMNYTKDFASRKGEELEILFPERMRTYLKTQFIKKLEIESKNDFDFFYFNPLAFEVKKFNFDFVTFQNLKSDVVYILGNYTMFNDDLLITNTNSNIEAIEIISLQWVKLIGLSPSFADYLKRKRVFLTMANFFTERKCFIPGNNNNLLPVDEEKTVYKVNREFLTNIKCNKFIINSEFDFPEIYLIKISEFTDEKGINKIYSIHSLNYKNHAGTTEIKSLRKNRFFLLFKHFIFNITKNDLHYIDEDENDNNSMNSSVAHFSDSKFKVEQKKSNKSSITKLSLSIVLYNCVLIIYCIVFFLVGYTNTSNLKSFYLFRSSFNSLKYNFYNTYISLYQNILLFQVGTEDISSYFAPGADYFAKFALNPDIKINIADYCVAELAIKLDNLKDKISNFQISLNSFSSSNSYGLIDDFSEIIDYYGFRIANDKIYLDKTELKFFDALSVLLNKGYLSFLPGTSFTSFWIVNFNDGVYDFTNIIDTKLNISQISVYEITQNYETYLRLFEKLTKRIDTLFSSNTTLISNTNVFFSIILVVLHLFYFLLCGYILHIFNYFITKYNLLISLFFNQESIEILNKKINLLKNLNQLYTKDPIKCLRDIEKINTNDKDKLKMIKNKFQANQSQFMKDMDKIGNENEETMEEFRYLKNLNANSKTNLILPYLKILAVIFSIYIVFFIITYYFFMSIFNNFLDVNTYSTNFIAIQNRNINNALLTQSIFANNQTDYQLNKFMTGDTSIGFLRQGFMDSYVTLTELQKLEQLNSLQGVKDIVNTITNCSIIYKSTDHIYKHFNDVTISSLIAACGTYQFMNNGDLYTLQYELIYLQQDLINFYEHTGQDYTKMKYIWDMFVFFDMLVINNIIMRPITEYIYNDLIYSVIISCLYNFIVYTVFYIISNMFVDILILYLINKLIITKIQKFEKEIKEFIQLY